MLGAWNQTSPGAGWAMDDPELAKLYPGKWAVALPNQLIAVGNDPDAVRAEAAEKLGLPLNSIVLTTIIDPATIPAFDWF